MTGVADTVDAQIDAAITALAVCGEARARVQASRHEACKGGRPYEVLDEFDRRLVRLEGQYRRLAADLALLVGGHRVTW